MPRPIVNDYAELIYSQLEPYARDDEKNDWHLLLYCNAISIMFQDMDDLIRDQDGAPGWSQIIDVTRAPDEILPWLAQLAGAVVDPVPPGQPIPPAYWDNLRQKIDELRHLKRGSPASMVMAIQETLTGNKQVIVRERDTSAWHLTVNTRTSETPDAAVTAAAMMSQKPAGIVAVHQVLTGQDWAELIASQASWTTTIAAYTDWQDVIEG